MVLAEQRQAAILERVRSHGFIQIADIAREMAVSEKTARRDLLALERRGLVSRVHGGATMADETTASEPAFITKAPLQHHAKVAIARATRALIEPGMSIGISSGTTTFEVARCLIDVPELGVVTNSLPIATYLHANGRTDLTLVVTGGIPTPSEALVGPLALASIAVVHVDLVIVGAYGIDIRSGVSTPNMVEADTDRALVAAGRKLVVVADHTKWGAVGVSSKVKLDAVDVLVSDSKLPPDAREQLSRHVGELIIADPADA